MPNDPTATAHDTPRPAATTNANGNYVFAGLGPGTYTVREILPAGWTSTTTNPVVLTVAVTGTPVGGVNFGQWQQPHNASTLTFAQQSSPAVSNQGNRQSQSSFGDSGLTALDLDDVGIMTGFGAGRRRQPRNGR